MVEDVDPFEPRIGSTTLQLPAGLVWVVRNASLFSDCAGTSEPANQRPACPIGNSPYIRRELWVQTSLLNLISLENLCRR